MLDKLKLENLGPVEGLEAGFAQRLNVITGDNGLGKSFLLDVCFWSLTQSWPNGRVALPRAKKNGDPSIHYSVTGKSKTTSQKTSTFDFHSQSWTRERGRPAMPGLVVYASVDGGFSVWDPARNYWKDPKTGEQENGRPDAYQFSPDSLANGVVTIDGKKLCNGLIQDWVEWYYQRTSLDDICAFRYLEEVIKVLSHPNEPLECGEPRKVYVDDTRKFPILKMPYGDVAFPQWSAGIRRVVGFAYLIVWAWSEHIQAAELRDEDPTDRIVLIVDEIEAHLHPKWQRTILPAILKVVEKLNPSISVQVISTTHSHLVMASVEPFFDRDTDRLFCFDLKDQKVTFGELPWAIHGDAVAWLTSDIFGLEQARSRESENAIEAAEAFLRGDQEKLPNGLKSKDEIENALRQLLPSLDPFWPRWLVESHK